jgi:hypothetical protein
VCIFYVRGAFWNFLNAVCNQDLVLLASLPRELFIGLHVMKHYVITGTATSDFIQVQFQNNKLTMCFTINWKKHIQQADVYSYNINIPQSSNDSKI